MNPPTRRAVTGALGAILMALAPLTIAAAAAQTIHPGDTVDVEVYNYKDLSAQTKISGQGTVALPLVGTVAVGGLSTNQAAQQISDRLRTYIKNPSVQVAIVAQGQTLFVVGSYSGTLTYDPGETLVSALSDLQSQSTKEQQNLKAGRADFAHSGSDLRRVKITRDGTTLGPYDSLALQAAGDPGPVLYPGDIISLAAKPVRVDVRGRVQDPGPQYIDTGEPLQEALNNAGGVLGDASAQVTLIRNGAPESITDGSPTFATLPAQNGDIIVVNPAPKVNVVGALHAPQRVTLTGDESLLSAIYLAGGPTDTANLKDVQVMHANSDKTFDITLLTHGDTDQNPVLSDGDVVFVPEGHKVNPSVILTGLGAIFSGLSLLRPW